MWIVTGRGKLLGLLEEDRWPFILVDRLFLVSHIEGITLGAGEEVDDVAGGASGMGVDRIGETSDRASEGQAPEVYGTDFTARPLARIGVRDRMQVPRIEFGSDEKLTEVRTMTECDWEGGEQEDRLEVEGSNKKM